MSSYAIPADLETFGVNATALASIPTEIQQGACEAASAICDSFFRARYKLPLVAWGVDVTRVAAVLATYDLLVVRGYNPSAGADINLRMRYDDAMLWLLHVSRQEVQPDVTPTQDQAAGFDSPSVATNPMRGYSRSRRVIA